MAHIKLTVGRLLCGEVRYFLDSCKFKGMDIEYLESSGWVQREFIVKGSDQAILSINSSLVKWVKEINSD